METDWPEVSEPASLSTDEVHVWAVSLQCRGREDEMWAMLSPEERGRAERFRVDSAASTVYGRACRASHVA